MKISSVLRVAALALLLSDRLPARQIFPIYTGTVPDSKPSAVRETSLTLESGGVRIANVVQPSLTAFLPAAGMATGFRTNTTKGLWPDRFRNWRDADDWLTN
ncbi:hypothetical protein [Hymenobacter antarcticus]|uniref:Uncharacterized protein n=1 Tax=Hymenobacter antarcticus TaxID=486270 RepID=A0ABP7PMR1_9BACT